MDKKFISLEDVLGRDAAELTAVKQGEYETDKLGAVPYTALDHAEYKQIKRDCVKMTPNGTGGMEPDVDDDKMMARVVIAAVNKDQRSTFTFANKELLAKLGVTTADEALAKLLSPGEIINFAVAVQNDSGFGQKAAKATQEAVKNS
ncbi:phage tail assembly chaperone [Paenibacillus sp. MMO-177]|uniref:phage tail assembly chaperone n=1 Tax=Paenibacillus sp. MMO-177 TaxID=3081289 RepID=UPI003017CA16